MNDLILTCAKHKFVKIQTERLLSLLSKFPVLFYQSSINFKVCFMFLNAPGKMSIQ